MKNEMGSREDSNNIVQDKVDALMQKKDPTIKDVVELIGMLATGLVELDKKLDNKIDAVREENRSAIAEIEHREMNDMLAGNYGGGSIIRRDRKKVLMDKFIPCGNSVKPSSTF